MSKTLFSDQLKTPFGDLKNTTLLTPKLTPLKGVKTKNEIGIQVATPTIKAKENVNDAMSPPGSYMNVIEDKDDVDIRNERLLSSLSESQFDIIFMEPPQPSPTASPQPEYFDESMDASSFDFETSSWENVDDYLPEVNLSL